MIPAVPAVVILGELNGLGIVRSLGRDGVKSYVLDDNRFAPAMWSRYARRVPVRSINSEGVIDELIKTRARLDANPVLFNTSEMTVVPISEQRSRLQDSF